VVPLEEEEEEESVEPESEVSEDEAA